MSNDLQFPHPHRPGEVVQAGNRSFTLDDDRKATGLSNEEMDGFHESFGSEYFSGRGMSDEDRASEERAKHLRGEGNVVRDRLSTDAYQLNPHPPSREYEDAATAREVAGKAISHVQSHIADIQAGAQRSAESNPNDGDPGMVGHASIDTGFGKVSAQSAALREEAKRRDRRVNVFEEGETLEREDGAGTAFGFEGNRKGAETIKGERAGEEPVGKGEQQNS